MFFLFVLFVFFTVSIMFYFLAVLLLVAFLVLLERKFLGLLQIRKGPNIVGIFGLLQTVMDGVKLLLKNFLVNTTNYFFFFSPLFFFLLSLFQWLVLPVQFQYLNMSYTILITFLLSGLMVYILLWTGWGSNNSFGFIGTIRGIAQMISYEVVFFFFLMVFMMLLGYSSWDSFLCSNGFFKSFFMFVFFMPWLVMVLLELNRAPFDLVEGESELVSGFNVEFSGFGFTLLFLAEYMNIWLLSFITSLIFWGGFYNLFVFTMMFIMVVLWSRGLLPRFKFLDIIFLTWKVYLPVIFFVLFMFCFSL
nr:NADH dehydrogenase subunit 1 [Microcosmus sp. z YZ-2024]